jgi:hypothetical protein
MKSFRFTATVCVLLSGTIASAQLPKLTPTPANERLVGLAYTTWFGPTDWSHVWGTPQLGCYRSDDRAVIRRDREG